jgi:hypothetical protein
MSGEPTPAKAEPLGAEVLGAETPAVPAAMAEPIPVPAPPAAPVPAPSAAPGTSSTQGVPATTAAPEAPAPPLVPSTPAAPATPADPVAATAATAAAPATPADPVAATAATAAAPAGRRRLVLLAGLGRLARFIVLVALLAGGVALGYASFQRAQPPVPVAGDPVTAGVAAPPIVQEFVSALAGNDPDGIRSAVPTEPYKLFTNEMQRWDFATVTSVKTLSTVVDGSRSSTAIVLIGTTSSGNPVSINLIVHADAGKIVSFR